MTVVLCVDSRGGLLFHNRRQSQDRILRQDLLREAAGCRLWMTPYSLGQFSPEETDGGPEILAAGTPAPMGMDFCFLEVLPPEPYLSQADRLLLYNWNRVYPADRFLSVPPEWTLTERQEFSGFSHPKLTKEWYRK